MYLFLLSHCGCIRHLSVLQCGRAVGVLYVLYMWLMSIFFVFSFCTPFKGPIMYLAKLLDFGQCSKANPLELEDKGSRISTIKRNPPPLPQIQIWFFVRSETGQSLVFLCFALGANSYLCPFVTQTQLGSARVQVCVLVPRSFSGLSLLL